MQNLDEQKIKLEQKKARMVLEEAKLKINDISSYIGGKGRK